jgi:beta-lactam-binding protein with PASTA domain
MARYFEISHNTATVKLDSQGRGTVQYKVKNVSAAPIDGRAVLISLPPANPPAGVVQNGWVKIEPPTDRAFDKDKQETFVVKIEVPQKDRSKAGTYTFRLDAVTVAIPDRGDEGPAVAFTLDPAPVKKPTPMLAWLIPLILVLLILIGLGAWFALRSTGPKVPDLAGMSLNDAVTALTAAKLTLAQPPETIQSKPEDSDKVVSQTPAAGAKAKEGDAVHVQIGAELIPVPMLVGHPYQEAQTMLTGIHLNVGKVTNAANPNFAGGVVFAQAIDPGTKELSGAAIDLSVTPQTVPVPPVTGSLLKDAINKINQAQLTVGGVTGDQIDKAVIAQNPQANTPLEIGGKVSLTVPSSSVCDINPRLCLFQQNTVQKMYAPQRLVVQPKKSSN